MTSLVLGIEQIVGLVQILDEHRKPVSLFEKICSKRRHFISSAKFWHVGNLVAG
jgi:hypothetical protein